MRIPKKINTHLLITVWRFTYRYGRLTERFLKKLFRVLLTQLFLHFTWKLLKITSILDYCHMKIPIFLRQFDYRCLKKLLPFLTFSLTFFMDTTCFILNGNSSKHWMLGHYPYTTLSTITLTNPHGVPVRFKLWYLIKRLYVHYITRYFFSQSMNKCVGCGAVDIWFC
jgi:hypothetical protein